MTNSVRIILLIIIVALIYFCFNQYYYPQRICSGDVKKQLIWTNKLTNEKKILNDEKTPLVISFIFKRGAILINDDRFPLYKELNDVNNFAFKTESGYKGEYSQHGLLNQESNFKFRFDEITSVLYTENYATGMHIYENNMGTDNLKIEFSGNCSRKLL